MRWRAVTTGLGAAAALALGVWALSGQAPGTVRPVLATPAAAGGATEQAPSGAPLPAPLVVRSGLESLPASLAGTEVGGAADEDGQGRLKVTRGLRDLFDYFLSASGEEAPALLRARVEAYLSQRLRATARAQAMKLFDAYVAYKRELDGLLLGSRASNADEAQARLHTVRASRGRHFTPDVVEAFFGDEATYDRYALDRQALIADNSLPPAEKARRLAALRAALPPALREQLGVVETVQTLDQLVQDWRQRQGDAAALREMREALVGPEATRRLEQLDQETAAWEQRVQAYRDQRARILADSSLADSRRQQLLQTLRDQSFAGTERIRIDTIDRHQDAASRDAASPASRSSPPG